MSFAAPFTSLKYEPTLQHTSRRPTVPAIIERGSAIAHAGCSEYVDYSLWPAVFVVAVAVAAGVAIGGILTFDHGIRSYPEVDFRFPPMRGGPVNLS